jgi:hypothetical protein
MSQTPLVPMIPPPILPLERQPKYVLSDEEIETARLWYMSEFLTNSSKPFDEPTNIRHVDFMDRISSVETYSRPMPETTPTTLLGPRRSLVHPIVLTPYQARVIREISSASPPPITEQTGVYSWSET